jgi:serine/threonine protein phosphatase PrpC
MPGSRRGGLDAGTDPPRKTLRARIGIAAMSFTAFRIESAALTHQGRVREKNQDSFCAREADGLWAVADGMGGHEGGEWASAKLVEELDRIAMPDALDAACAQAEEAIKAANLAIVAEAGERGRQMGSTIVALVVKGERYAILWVGDSRAYLLRDGKLVQLSRDHSQVQEMVDRGMMAPEQAIGHPMGHILSRAVGVRDGVAIDRVEGDVLPGDVFLLSSDGLHGYVEEAEIRRLLGRGSPQRALDELIELTLAAGAPDNVTGIAVWASDPTLLSFASVKP